MRYEVRSLIYLALVTNRALILPNVLGYQIINKILHIDYFPGSASDLKYTDVYEELALWPGFRVAHVSDDFNKNLNILEPSFYWRVRRDFSDSQTVTPTPLVVTFNDTNSISLRDIEDILKQPYYDSYPRIVINYQLSTKRYPNTESIDAQVDRLSDWSSDSVGNYDEYNIERKRYKPLPQLSVKNKLGVRNVKLAYDIVDNIRLCDHIFVPNRGNRSCFDKCD